MRKRATEDAAVVAVAEPESYDGLGEFDPERARPLVLDVIGRKMPMLAAYKDLDRDDLVQIGMMALSKAHPAYDPAKSKYSTFVNMVVGRQLIDVWKVRSREYHRFLGAAKPGHVGPAEIEDDAPDDLAAWVGNVVGLARVNMRRYLGGYEPAQVAAMLALQRRERLRPEETVKLLEERADVRKALGIEKAPPVELLRASTGKRLRLWFG